MNESAWNGTTGEVKDFSVNGNNGTATNGPTITSSGKYGNAGSFDGSNDYVNIGNTIPVLQPTGNFTVAGWFKTVSPNQQQIFSSYYQSTTIAGIILGVNVGGSLQHKLGILTGKNTGTTNNTDYKILNGTSNVDDGNWHYGAGVWDGTTLYLYVDGNLEASTPWSDAPGYAAGNSVHIGNHGFSAGYFSGNLDDTRVYNRALAASEVQQLYQNPGSIASYPSSSITFATEEKAPQPVAYWAFDEGTGTVVNDGTSNKNNGTLVNMATSPSATNSGWMSEDMCVSGKCLGFDGINDYVRNTAVSLNPSTAFTLSFWMKLTRATNTDVIGEISSGTTCNNNPQVWISNGGGGSTVGDVVLGKCGNGNGPSVGSATSIVNKWTYITFVYNGTTTSAYKDGVLISTFTYTWPSFSTSWLTMGGARNDLNFMRGFLDEVKVYPYARTAAQVKADFASRGGSIGNSGVLGVASNNNIAALSQGLVGYWKMNEATWSGTLNEVLDSSGNGNNGQAYGAASAKAYPGVGKYGNGGVFDGVDDYVSMGNVLNSGTSDFTWSSWIYARSPGTGRQTIMAKDQSSGPQMRLNLNDAGNTGKLYFTIGGSLAYPFVSNSVISSNAWTLVTVTRSGGQNYRIYINGVLDSSATSTSVDNITSSVNFQLGARVNPGGTGGFDLFNGSLDETRVYNRALSSADVSNLYNFAPGPVGYWNLDEKSGTTASDTSGNGNTGTLNGSPSWVSGKVGGATQFSGSNTITVPDSTSTNFGTGDFTMETWVKTTAYPTSPGTYGGYIYKLTNSGGFTGYDLGVGTTGQLRFELGDTAGIVSSTFGASAVVPLNTWTHVAVSVNRSAQATLYINGIKAGTPITVSARTGSVTNPAVVTLSRDAVGGVYHQGILDEVKLYNYARTQSQIMEDMQGSHPAVMGARTGSMVGYWDFDEGYGTTANDRSGNNNVGTLTNMATAPSTSTSGWSGSGRFNKALNFDGSNDVVSMGNQSSLDPQGSFSLSTWVKTTQSLAGSTYGSIVGKGQLTGSINGYGIFLNGDDSSKVVFQVRQVTGNTFVQVTGGSINDGRWHHVVGTRDYSTNTSKIYVDGVLKSTDSTTALTTGSNTAPFSIGARDASGFGFFFSGSVDETKFYNGVLTAEDVKRDYNRGTSQQMGSTGTTATGVNDNSGDRSYCPPGDSTATCGPVGEWNFEEKQGTTANDSTGNGNTGTLTSGPAWTTGKIGAGVSLDGVDDYINVPFSTSLDFSGTNKMTVSTWYKTSEVKSDAFIVIHNSTGATGRILEMASGRLYFQLGNGTTLVSVSDPAVTADGKWHYGVATYDGSNLRLYRDGLLVATNAQTGNLPTTSAGNLIGQGNNSLRYFTGQLDQIRFYNYARSAAQVAWDYNRGAPLAWYDLDECQGNIAHDNSGFGNDGTINLGASGTQTTAGTCQTSSTAWGNGVTGKINSSLNFDGTDDYICILSGGSCAANALFTGLTTSRTYSVWLKTTATTRRGILTNVSNFVLDINQSASGKIRYYGGGGFIYSNKAVNDGNWHLLTVTQSGTAATIYIDGVLDNTGTFTPSTPSGAFYIGSDSGLPNYFQGQLDDVRVYNYPLTSQQVKTLYTGGAIRFAPSTGQP
jgi:hypothetical protein